MHAEQRVFSRQRAGSLARVSWRSRLPPVSLPNWLCARETNDFEVRKVKLGSEQEEMVTVLDGVSAGEQVVTKGSFVLKPEIITGGNMKRSRILTVLTVGFWVSLLFWTVAQEQESPAQDDNLARGEVLFVKYCTGCHGPQGEGGRYRFLRGPDPANLTSPSIGKKSDADLLKTIHDGKPNMPPWNVRLSEGEMKDVLAYVRTLK